MQKTQNDSDPGCPFCHVNLNDRIIDEYESTVVIEDGYPVTEGHLLIIPKRHVSDFHDLTKQERDDIASAIIHLRKRISDKDTKVTGFNVGINIGESAGQSIFHAHVHLIPRRDGDTEEPKGGVRGVIPGKRGY